MSERRRRASLAPRLAGLFGLLFLGLLAVFAASIQPRLAAIQRQLLDLRAEEHARLAGRLLSTPLELDAVDHAESILAALFEDPTVVSVVVEDGPGRVWASGARERQGEADYRSEAVQPLRGWNGEEIGRVRVVASDAPVTAARTQAIRDGLLPAAALLLAYLLAIAVLVRRALAPLNRISEAAERIADGHVDTPGRGLSRDDELGRAQLAFTRMQSRLLALDRAAEQVEAGHLEAPKLGPGPLFRRFDAMVATLARAKARDEETQRELRSAVERAEAANETKARFLARMSHELRTPLNGALGLIDLARLNRHPLTDDDVDIIHQSALEMVELIDQLLNFAKVDVGEIEFQEVLFDVSELLAGTRSRYRKRAEERGLELVAKGPEASWRAFGDPRALSQALGCLVDNALKFTTEGQISIVASMKPFRSSGKACLRIEVRDTGPGVDPHRRAQIFEAFEQADGDSTRSHRGMGIGLSLAASLMKGLGGTLGLEDTRESGSCFYLEVLVRNAEIIETSPTSATTRSPGARKRVLLVEDDPMNQLVAQLLLESLGTEVFAAENGAEALEALQASTFDLVLMDLMMPVMDGWTAAREIRAREGGVDPIPIVALTANALPGDREKAMRAGMDEHVSKPVRREALEEVLRRWT